jgi:hypothetical protein
MSFFASFERLTFYLVSVSLVKKQVIQTAQCPLQPQPIPPVQYSDHFALVVFYERLPNLLLPLILWVCCHDFLLHHGSVSVTLVAALLR